MAGLFSVTAPLALRDRHLLRLRWLRSKGRARGTAGASVAGSELRRARLGFHQGSQAAMVLGTGRTPLEVFAHSGDLGVGVGPPQLQLDIAIELGEAFLATELGPMWSEQPAEQTVWARASVFAHRRARWDSDATSGAVGRAQYDFLSRGASM